LLKETDEGRAKDDWKTILTRKHAACKLAEEEGRVKEWEYNGVEKERKKMNEGGAADMSL
jgi:hypothetical protein